jgi:hypothetical protein
MGPIEDRWNYRKTQRMIDHTHGGFAGDSIIEKLTDQLELIIARHSDTTLSEKRKNILRGEVLGLSWSIALMRDMDAKDVIRESVARVKGEQP